ncbi:MAG TPA: hypothetical protein DEB31_06900 [Clostridiales bacterium]|nr:hypothetical protein [Clostridiales bacterium]
MPYVNISTTKKMNEDEKQTLLGQVGRAITLIPGKAAEGTLIKLDAGATLVKKGAEGDLCMTQAYLYGESPHEAKDSFVREMFRYYTEEMGIPQKNIYISVEGCRNWGFDGWFHDSLANE